MIPRLYRPEEKTTAKNLSKEIILEAIESAYYWEEKTTVAREKMTEVEKIQVHREIERQIMRVRKLLTTTID